MYSESDIEAAVAAGALSPDSAQRLRAYVAASRASPAVDEEHFRLLTGFNDIFVAIAAVILLIAVGWIGQTIAVGPEPGAPSPFAGLFVAAAAWGLALFFTARRRMALPSIVLLLAFVGGAFGAAAGVLAAVVPETALNNNEALAASLLAGCAAVAAGAAWLHWRRFKVPVAIAAGALAAAGLVLGLIAAGTAQMTAQREILLGFALLLGIGVFLLAMWWDSSDPARTTRRADVAFWLHLLAAPLIVHPIFSLLGLTGGTAGVAQAALVLALYVGLGLTALAIDRRALLVSALAYVLFALSSLFDTYGVVELSFALTALIIGSALLLLSAFWHNMRREVVRRLPTTLQARLPVLNHTVPATA
ncbi:MAG: hypothetical protein ACK4K7_06255 [Allosphingosinicella sp.]|uniref:hypothetical protein n=1 Tax=Allosphingosinicella sp. TaxID=2823234 RepID=UPI003948E439